MSFLYVKVYHGPCNTFNNVTHKPQMLNGLRTHLHTLGFRVDLIPVDKVNYCMVEICSHQVFRCNIQNFKFNTCHDRDVVCQRAVEAVMEASVKFRRARAYLWFWTLIEHQLFRRSKHGLRDFWPDDLKIDPPNVDIDAIDIEGLKDVDGSILGGGKEEFEPPNINTEGPNDVDGSIHGGGKEKFEPPKLNIDNEGLNDVDGAIYGDEEEFEPPNIETEGLNDVDDAVYGEYEEFEPPNIDNEVLNDVDGAVYEGEEEFQPPNIDNEGLNDGDGAVYGGAEEFEPPNIERRGPKRS